MRRLIAKELKVTGCFKQSVFYTCHQMLSIFKEIAFVNY